MDLSGEYDISNAAELRARLEQAVDAAPGEVVQVDVGGVTFLDSSAISAIVGAYKLALPQGGSVVVVNASDHVRRLLELTGVADSLLP